MFLSYGGDKVFFIKGYVDASFDTNPDDLSLNLDTYWKWEQLARVAHAEHCRYRNLQNTHIDLNVADPLTKLLSQAKHDHALVLFGC